MSYSLAETISGEGQLLAEGAEVATARYVLRLFDREEVHGGVRHRTGFQRIEVSVTVSGASDPMALRAPQLELQLDDGRRLQLLVAKRPMNPGDLAGYEFMATGGLLGP